MTAPEQTVKTKLKTKFFLFITSAIILVMAAYVFIVSRSTERQLTNLVRERLQKPLHGFKHEYAKRGNESLDKVTSLVTNDDLKKMCDRINSNGAGGETREQCQEFLDDWLKNAGLDFIEIYALDGKKLAAFPPDRSILAGEMIAATIGSLPEPSKESVNAYGDGKLLAVIATAPIRSSEGQPLFTVMAGFALDDEFINDMKSLSGLEYVLFAKQKSTRFCAATTLWEEQPDILEKNRPLIPSYFDKLAGGYGAVYVADKYLLVEMIPIAALDGTTIVGEMWGGLPAGHLQETIKSTRQVLIIIGLVAVLLFSTAGYIFTGRITSPLKKLQDGISAISHGDYNSRVEVETTDELGSLAAAFNTMSEKLQDTISKLQAIYEVNQIMNTCSDPDEVAEMMVQILQLGFGVNTCAIMLAQPGTPDLKIKSSYGLAGETVEHFTIVPGSDKLGEAVAARERLVIKRGNGLKEAMAGCSAEDVETAQFILCQPMVSGDQVAGVLCIFSLDVDELDDELARFFGLFASLMGPTFLYTQTVQEQETSGVSLFKGLRERVQAEIDRAAQYRRPVSLAKVTLAAAPTVTKEEWLEGQEAVAEHFATASRDILPASAAVLRSGANSFYFIMPGMEHKAIEEQLKNAEVKARGAVELQFDMKSSGATFPDMAKSAAALIAAVDNG